MAQKLPAEELLASLQQFTGTAAYHRTGFATLATDGARFLAERAGAFWLLDVVDSVIPVIGDEFAVLDLTVDLALRTGRIRIHNGFEPLERAYRVFHDQEVPYTDFPLGSVRLFVQNRIVMLPSEY